MNNLYLLNTHVLIWAVAEPHKLNQDTRDHIENNQYAMSVASLWELVNKKQRSDAPVKDPLAWWDRYVIRARTHVLPIRTEHVLYLDRLPWRHNDPFDRILMAQSAVEVMPSITKDSNIHRYRLNTKLAFV